MPHPHIENSLILRIGKNYEYDLLWKLISPGQILEATFLDVGENHVRDPIGLNPVEPSKTIDYRPYCFVVVLLHFLN